MQPSYFFSFIKKGRGRANAILSLLLHLHISCTYPSSLAIFFFIKKGRGRANATARKGGTGNRELLYFIKETKQGLSFPSFAPQLPAFFPSLTPPLLPFLLGGLLKDSSTSPTPSIPLQPPGEGWRGLERVGWKKNSSTSPTPSLGWERVGWKVGREECGDNIRSHSLFNKLVMLNLILHSTYIYILLRNVLFLKKLQYVINPVTKKGCI